MTQLLTVHSHTDPRLQPDEPLCRHAELDTIRSALNPLHDKQQPRHVYVHGQPASGKTLIVKHVLNEFQDDSPIASKGVDTCYVDCADHRTKTAVFEYLLDSLGFDHGLEYRSASNLKNAFKQHVADHKPLLIALDDIEFLKDPTSTVFELVRLIETVETPIGLVLVSNTDLDGLGMDQQVRSHLQAREVEFAPYAAEDLREILEDVAPQILVDAGDADAVIQQSVLLTIAEDVAWYEGGDCRTAIRRLIETVENAEWDDVQVVSEQHLPTR